MCVCIRDTIGGLLGCGPVYSLVAERKYSFCLNYIQRARPSKEAVRFAENDAESSVLGSLMAQLRIKFLETLQSLESSAGRECLLFWRERVWALSNSKHIHKQTHNWPASWADHKQRRRCILVSDSHRVINVLRREHSEERAAKVVWSDDGDQPAFRTRGFFLNVYLMLCTWLPLLHNMPPCFSLVCAFTAAAVCVWVPHLAERGGSACYTAHFA